MGETRRISVALDGALSQEVDNAVASGDYPSERAVIDEALRSWQRARTAEIERLRALVQKGLDSGPPIDGNFDSDAVERRNRPRLAALRRGE